MSFIFYLFLILLFPYFEEIYSNNISKLVKVLERFETQFSKREKVLEENRRNIGNENTPCDLLKDPLFSSL